jgi:hypothetical protein
MSETAFTAGVASLAFHCRLWQNVNLTPLCLLSLIQITVCQNLMVCRCSLIMVNSGTRVCSVLICFENHLVPASAPEHTDRHERVMDRTVSLEATTICPGLPIWSPRKRSRATIMLSGSEVEQQQ